MEKKIAANDHFQNIMFMKKDDTWGLSAPCTPRGWGGGGGGGGTLIFS